MHDIFHRLFVIVIIIMVLKLTCGRRMPMGVGSTPIEIIRKMDEIVSSDVKMSRRNIGC